jgi:hypothetical protein
MLNKQLLFALILFFALVSAQKKLKGSASVASGGSEDESLVIDGITFPLSYDSAKFTNCSRYTKGKNVVFVACFYSTDQDQYHTTLNYDSNSIVDIRITNKDKIPLHEFENMFLELLSVHSAALPVEGDSPSTGCNTRDLITISKSVRGISSIPAKSQLIVAWSKGKFDLRMGLQHATIVNMEQQCFNRIWNILTMKTKMVVN